jgi:uncharacterized protein YecE (DUF72 family)
VRALDAKLGPLLVQLPPSLHFQVRMAEAFLAGLRQQFDGGVVCEPRHRSWFAGEADQLLDRLRVARVAADPATVPQAARPGGWPGLAYFRLHGSPQMYHSPYGEAALDALAPRLSTSVQERPTWCIFDNTAQFAAGANALSLWRRLASSSQGSSPATSLDDGHEPLA